jgi:hypothetical protein
MKGEARCLFAASPFVFQSFHLFFFEISALAKIMEAACTLSGITMETPGVSKVISVRPN